LKSLSLDLFPNCGNLRVHLQLEARLNIGKYLKFYNEERLHQALDYNTPSEVYFSGLVDREAINY